MIGERIKKIREDEIDECRILVRVVCEKIARRIIERSLGRMDRNDLELLMYVIGFDVIGGELLRPIPGKHRFGPMFTRNKKKILGNDLELINKLIVEIWDKENMDIDHIIGELNGIDCGFVSLIFYLRDPEKYAILTKKTGEGIEKLFNIRLPKTPFKARYLKFNEYVNILRKYGVKPQEIDTILAVIADEE